MLSTIQIKTPRWSLPLLNKNRYKGAYGGRGSGKSHLFAEMLIEEHVLNPNQYSVCIREVQSSIKMSVKRLLELKIQSLGVDSYFEVQESVIKSTKGDGIIIFQGMQNHTADSIKSLEGFDRCWCEESQSLSQRSLDLLRPTIRKEDSEMWFSWNPNEPTDPIDVLLRPEDDKDLPPDAVVVRVNYSDNPWFPDVLKAEMEYDKARDPDKYAHVWLGEYRKNSEARVFKNWRIEEFEAPLSAMHRLGADWGYSKDPTTLVRSHVIGRNLYVDYEAYEIGCEILDIPDLFASVPDSDKWPCSADSARPEIISHMRKHGYPKMHPSTKGKNSVYEGVMFLQTFDIVVHPRCVHTSDELSVYSWKIDPMTGKVTNILQDKKNHVIDPLRYSSEGARRATLIKRVEAKAVPVANRW